MMINIESLKRNILSLALEGKLTEQLESDGDSKLLIAESARKKQEFLKLKKIELNEPEEEDKVFSIPVSWNWAKLSNISQIESGGTPSRSEKKYWNGTIPWLKIGDLNSKRITKSSEYITELGLKNSSARIFKRGTILYTIFATIGVVSILDIDASTNQAIAGLSFFGNIDRDYLYYVLVGLKDILVGKSHGMTQSNINLTILKNIFIPMPPLEEQKRIVAKLDEIFAELDKIDEKQTRLATIQENMEAKILKLAIQGKLVEQRQEEGTGEDLFKLIHEEKQQLIKEGKIKKEKTLPAIEDIEIPFEIPSTWKWVRLGELGNYKKGPFGSALTKSMFVPKSDDSIKVYEQKNAIKKDWKLGTYYIRKNYYESDMKGFTLLPGDIIVSCAGTIGETYVIPKEAEIGIINQALMRMRIMKNLNLDYFLMYFDVILKGTANDNCKGTAIMNIPPFNILKNMLVPLPPLEEQKRIVAKIEQLLPLCRCN